MRTVTTKDSYRTLGARLYGVVLNQLDIEERLRRKSHRAGVWPLLTDSRR